MKKIFFIIFLFLCSQLQAQKKLAGYVTAINPGKLVVLKDLPRASYRPAVNVKKRSANEEEENEETRNGKSYEEKLLKQEKERPFTPAIIHPLNAGSLKSDGPQSVNLYEAPCAGYTGMRRNLFIPPDVTSATGFDHIMLADNDSFRVIDKYGQNMWQEAEGQAGGFWSTAGGTNLFDPKLTYDALSNRWIFVIITDARTAASSILIAVSTSYDPTAGWWLYRIDTDADNDQWFDYPSVGFNRNWIVITGNMFSNPNAGGTTESRSFIFDKAPMYLNGGGTSIGVYNTSSYSTICPALTYDGAENDLWLATNDDVDENDIRYFKISGAANSPSMTEEGFISITGAWGRGDNDLAPQQGTSTLLNAGDHRILSAVMRGGRLYTAQTVFFPSGGSPTTSTLQMISATPGSTTVHEAYRMASGTTSMYAFPNMTVNANGDWIISCARFTNTIFPSSVALVKRNGSPGFTETMFASGQDWYVSYDNSTPQRNRWGDYYGAMVDPSDDNSVWLSGEFSIPRIGTVGQWQSQISKICSGICSTNVSVNTVQVTGTYKKFEADNTVFASSEIQPGAYVKLDGGVKVVLQPGFKASSGCKVRVFAEGCGGVQ